MRYTRVTNPFVAKFLCVTKGFTLKLSSYCYKFTALTIINIRRH